MKYHAVLFDLDGTLLRSDKTISAYTLDALRRAGETGALMIPASGRPVTGLQKELQEAPWFRYVITGNGSRVWDRVEMKLLSSAELPLSLAEEIFDFLEQFPVAIDCFIADEGWIERETLENIDRYVQNDAQAYVVRSIRKPVDGFRDFVRSRGLPVQKLQCLTPDLELLGRIRAELAARFGSQLSLAGSLGCNVEVNAKDANKGRGMEALCRAIDLPFEQVVAFGDEDNDLGMLRQAGLGVAMANAAQVAKDAADALTESNDDDGVARELDRLMAAGLLG